MHHRYPSSSKGFAHKLKEADDKRVNITESVYGRLQSFLLLQGLFDLQVCNDQNSERLILHNVCEVSRTHSMNCISGAFRTS